MVENLRPKKNSGILRFYARHLRNHSLILPIWALRLRVLNNCPWSQTYLGLHSEFRVGDKTPEKLKSLTAVVSGMR